MAFCKREKLGVAGDFDIMVNIRNKREIDLIRESSQIVYETLTLLGENIKPGVTGEKLNKIAEKYIYSRGATPAFKGYMEYPKSICISINEEVVHGIPNRRKLNEGDIVAIDCGVLKDGYYGDSAWTYTVGQIDADVMKLMTVTEKALYIGIEQAKSGNRLSDIGHVIQSYVESHGFNVVRELVGHGIGTELHEDPQIPNYGDPGEGILLKSGMCLAIEPMVNLGGKEVYTRSDGWTVCTRDGKPSAHFEHTVVVSDNGGKILSDGTIDK